MRRLETYKSFIFKRLMKVKNINTQWNGKSNYKVMINKNQFIFVIAKNVFVFLMERKLNFNHHQVGSKVYH